LPPSARCSVRAARNIVSPSGIGVQAALKGCARARAIANRQSPIANHH
jgi:hypothetical protein